MTSLSIASVIHTESGEQSLKTIALFGCIGLMMSLCLMTMGVDFGTAWMV